MRWPSSPLPQWRVANYQVNLGLNKDKSSEERQLVLRCDWIAACSQLFEGTWGWQPGLCRYDSLPLFDKHWFFLSSATYSCRQTNTTNLLSQDQLKIRSFWFQIWIQNGKKHLGYGMGFANPHSSWIWVCSGMDTDQRSNTHDLYWPILAYVRKKSWGTI